MPVASKNPATTANIENKIQSSNSLRLPEYSLEKAEAGDAYSQAIMGIKYRIGDGVPVDWTKAFKFSSDSSAQGNPLGAYNLGRLYENKCTGKDMSNLLDNTGQDFEQDRQSADKCFSGAVPGLKRLADSGDSYAQVAFGWCLQTGSGIDSKELEVANWYRKAAEQGNSSGQTYLGVWLIFSNQTVVNAQLYNGLPSNYSLDYKQNKKEGWRWLGKAADQGNAEGQFIYGKLLTECQGGTEQIKQAGFRWLQSAAEKGHKEAAKIVSVAMKQAALPTKLKTSLKDGPSEDALFNGLCQAYSAEVHRGGRVVDTIDGRLFTDASIENEYTRTIDGETVYFFQFDIERGNQSHGTILSGFVKRGNQWYLQSINGNRINDF
jgi:hypothetical protein